MDKWNDERKRLARNARFRLNQSVYSVAMLFSDAYDINDREMMDTARAILRAAMHINELLGGIIDDGR